MSATFKHLSKPLDWREAACGHTMTGSDSLPTSNPDVVTCADCKVIIANRAAAEPSWEEKLRREWTVAAVAGDTDLGFDDWSREQGVGPSTPLHTPPRMEDERGMVDGVFVFYDTHLGPGYTLEVVPQLSGNVEVTLSGPDDGTTEDGILFSLSLFDRVNLLQALLHEFHYGPEVGGPADDQD